MQTKQLIWRVDGSNPTESDLLKGKTCLLLGFSILEEGEENASPFSFPLPHPPFSTFCFWESQPLEGPASPNFVCCCGVCNDNWSHSTNCHRGLFQLGTFGGKKICGVGQRWILWPFANFSSCKGSVVFFFDYFGDLFLTDKKFGIIPLLFSLQRGRNWGYLTQFGISLDQVQWNQNQTPNEINLKPKLEQELEEKWGQRTFPDDPSLGFSFDRGDISFAGNDANSRATQVLCLSPSSPFHFTFNNDSLSLSLPLSLFLTPSFHRFLYLTATQPPESWEMLLGKPLLGKWLLVWILLMNFMMGSKIFLVKGERGGQKKEGKSDGWWILLMGTHIQKRRIIPRYPTIWPRPQPTQNQNNWETILKVFAIIFTLFYSPFLFLSPHLFPPPPKKQKKFPTANLHGRMCRFRRFYTPKPHQREQKKCSSPLQGRGGREEGRGEGKWWWWWPVERERGEEEEKGREEKEETRKKLGLRGRSHKSEIGVTFLSLRECPLANDTHFLHEKWLLFFFPRTRGAVSLEESRGLDKHKIEKDFFA